MEKNNPHISIVIPVYAHENCLMELYNRLKESLEQITSNFEIIMVNDASPDNAWQDIVKLANIDSRVKGINLSRNFGQHYAITAGLDYVKGDWVVVMDCDLQDQPEEIIKLYNKAQEGFDIVYGRRYERQDSFLKKVGSILFHKVYHYFTDIKSDSSIANFSICSREVIKNFRKLREQNRSYPLFLAWVGFSTTSIDIEHSARTVGKSTYNFSRMLSLAIDAIVAQSNKPLRLSINFGFFISFMSLIYALRLVYKYLFWSQPVAGWTSVMVSIYFLGGLMFANMGVLGLYLGKIFNETKNRPLYIVKDTLGLHKDKPDYLL